MLGSTVGVNQCVVCLLMSSMSHLYGAGSCRHRFIGVCSKLENQLSSTIAYHTYHTYIAFQLTIHVTTRKPSLHTIITLSLNA